MLKLRDYQLDAISRLKNGNILCGGVGSGKSLTSIGYYYLKNGGSKEFLKGGEYKPMTKKTKLYIITTAKKRDSLEWDKELSYFLLSSSNDSYYPGLQVTVDSWNNIGKYVEVENAQFIFDEQRLIGSGAWVKAFYKIAKKNDWILLSATPGDTWMDYIPVFIANGFYKNKTDFCYQHVIWNPRTNFPQVSKYYDTNKLDYYRNKILIDMEFARHTKEHHIDIYTDYDKDLYRKIMKERINPWDFNEEFNMFVPIKNANELCLTLRKLVNSDISKQKEVVRIVKKHKKVIIFYNFNYELDILRSLDYGPNVTVSEWNGQNHNPIPETDSWVYLVQYIAGAEGWNCISTDTMIFFSPNYSYRIMLQSSGRINRMNTPFTDLYYYHLKTRSNIDLSIEHAIKTKKNFSESAFFKSCTK